MSNTQVQHNKQRQAIGYTWATHQQHKQDTAETSLLRITGRAHERIVIPPTRKRKIRIRLRFEQSQLGVHSLLVSPVAGEIKPLSTIGETPQDIHRIIPSPVTLHADVQRRESMRRKITPSYETPAIDNQAHATLARNHNLPLPHLTG